ncbi:MULTISPECIES: ABC transporter substrate-binding protein [unclassified Mesorhizobium]|uniref:ABC transporter substrate-binding protein n=1 Tax=unclassified Mesorhizobium TaxID=325217 RepID=UPI0008F2E0EB|nr:MULTISPECIES: ABC transporter substrate-binding protein [unclassified Mesorhizobium]RJG45069.1 branched-chain amino acid ABC transporter substrate-binding protein [Mesorhizobium sp. DCY119]SFT89346.1 amino acid/amide ABC transporter substrate-binding protein, HAAT family [Mesorhizobium sp. YR577]
MKFLRLAISAAVSAIALGTAAAEPVKIAFLTPKTGPLAFIGAMYDPTINFVQKPFNEAAGETGNTLDIAVYDDSGTTQGAADRFKQAIADGARVFIGAGTSPLAAQNLADIRRWNQRNPDDPAMLLIVGSEGSNFIGSDCDFYSFHFTTTPFIRQNALAKVMKDEGSLGEKVYSLQPDYTMGREMEAAVGQNAEAYGYKVVGQTRHDVFKIKDFSPFIEKVRATAPDTIFTASSGSDLRLILQAASASGLKARFASTFLDEPGNLAAAGASALDSHSAQLFNAEASGEAGEKYRAAFNAAAGRDPVAYMNNSVQTLSMLSAAITARPKADKVAVNDLAKSLETVQVDWPHGKLSMRAEDHQIQLPLVITKVSKNARDKVDGTDMGFEPVKVLSAEETSLPVSADCKMKRP